MLVLLKCIYKLSRFILKNVLISCYISEIYCQVRILNYKEVKKNLQNPYHKGNMTSFLYTITQHGNSYPTI